MLDNIFRFLLDKNTKYMQETYIQFCNAEFRRHPDSYIKACVLFEQYALQIISIVFDKKGIRVTGLSIIKNLETKTNYAPVEVYYKVVNGSHSIAKLILAYNRTINKRKIFSLENDMLIIKGNTNHWIDVQELTNLNENEIVASLLDGGEERLKELVEEINRRIIDYNKKLFDRTQIICND